MYWRDFFGGDNKNIFDIIKNSILIAAADFPKEFESQRDQIAQTLFTCGTARCHNCNSLELHLAKNEICEFRDGDGGRIEDGGKESKVNSSTTNDLIGNCSYEDVEALTEEIMEENQIVTEVYRIKEILINKNDESDSMLYESLRRIQLMRLSVEIIEETEIEKAINSLRRHRSKEIQHLVQTVIMEWKELASDWVKVESFRQEPTPESKNLSCFDGDDDYGLLSPPLDEGAFFATAHTTSMELSKFFDGMDNDGNLLVDDEEKGGSPVKINSSSHQSCGNPVKINSSSHQSCGNPVKINSPSHQSSECDDYSNWLQEADHGGYNQRKKVQETKTKPPKSNGGDNGGSRLSGTFDLKKRQNLSHCFASTSSMKSDKPDMTKKVQKKPMMATVENNTKSSDDNSFRTKIEIAKRLLQERYSEANNAKKQKTIQVMELEDLPKRGNNRRRSQPKQGNSAKPHGRLWPNRR
ncbi:hypothetical protein ZOSMA_170G00100 [Zostera marina]|uniref:TFIIS N-terminal domain-containing protein n=1 Tax=Zostera marina TaxID=29655 RepID=A0A0K9PSP8_ZOSMR|nr:hypothetical protein ZOSMA_170G00100 [Zostera marina]